METADLTAPLDALDKGQLSELVGGALPSRRKSAAAADNNWVTQIRTLRESGQLDAALSMSKAQFPKTQAFQQAAIILRQRDSRRARSLAARRRHPARTVPHCRASPTCSARTSSHKPVDPQAALNAVRNLLLPVRQQSVTCA